MADHWFRAANPKQLAICLKMLYANDLPYLVHLAESKKNRIEYYIKTSASEEQLVELQELYRILIS